MLDNMHDNILNVILKFEKELFWIKRYPDFKCTCIDNKSSEPDPKCKKCLGTGTKIKIFKITGAHLDSQVPATVRQSSDFIVSRDFYIKSTYDVNEGDIIIDDNNAYKINKIKNNYGFKGENVYKKCLAPDKVGNEKPLINNFNMLLKKIGDTK